MDSHGSVSQTSLPNYGENNGSSPDVSTGSVSDGADSTPSSKQVNSQQPAGSQPAMVFSTACPAREESDNPINYGNDGVVRTGSALSGKVGPVIGSLDIAESEDDYVFRVALPGVARDEKLFCGDARPCGKILIRGVSTTGEARVCRDNMVFEMQTHNLCPPGEFSVSFQLPGPIDHQNVYCVFECDGILEGVVKKKKLTGPLRGS